jgi:hypothetical protein
MLTILLKSSPTPNDAHSIKSATKTLNKPILGILNPTIRLRIAFTGTKKKMESKLIKIPNPTGCPPESVYHSNGKC